MSACLTVGASEAGAEEPPTLTREQAEELPPAQVAEIVFRQLAARVGSSVAVHPSPMAMRTSLGEITFALPTRSSGDFGLCQSTLIDVEFAPAGTPAFHAINVPVLATEAATRTVYRVVGDVARTERWNDRYGAWLAERCRRVGQPALVRDTSGRGALFFTFEGALRPAAALIVLQRLKETPSLARSVEIRCGEGDEGENEERNRSTRCDNPAAVLAEIDLDELDALSIGPSDVPGSYAIEANFLSSAVGGHESNRTFRIVAQIDDPDSSEPTIGRIGPVEFETGSLIAH